MRLAILVQDGHFGRAALAALLAHPSPLVEPSLVIEGCHPQPGPGPWLAAAYRFEAWLGGSKSQSLTGSPLGAAIKLGIGHRSIISLTTSGWTNLLQRFRIDALACLGFHQLLPSAAIAAVKLALNAHPSRLPQWRGPSPIFWWLHSGQESNGVSIHHMVASADAGPLVEQQSLVPPSMASGGELASLHGELAGRAMAHCLDQGARGQLIGFAQQGRPSWAPRPRPEDAFVRPRQWTSARLVRFASGAGLWQAPRLMVGDSMFFARRGLGFQSGGRLPGDFVIVGDTLTVATADGCASFTIQQETGRPFA